MGDIAVRVQGLSKQYRIGKQESSRNFREVLTDALYAPFRRTAGLLRGNASAAANLNETFWALKDVSFEIKKGDVVGIIGRNGAGKSTLLKILSRISEPTEGQVDIYGRVGALLEVGTGFHAELTGRENIYLNGAILGMSREEIRRKFDEIVTFAEVEKFIDTPVKHYSSGMGLRLGFAVAAHLEPEILIVDEVLAVGDAAFQKKCLGKMGEVAGEGRTVLFVSHNMPSISVLCSSCILLEYGSVSAIGNTSLITHRYLSSQSDLVSGKVSLTDVKRAGSGQIRITAIKITSPDQNDVIYPNDTVNITIQYKLSNEYNGGKVDFGIEVADFYGSKLMTCSTQFTGEHFMNMLPEATVSCTIANLPLVPGVYLSSAWCAINGVAVDRIENFTEFTVSENDFYGTGKLPNARKHGPFLVKNKWELIREAIVE